MISVDLHTLHCHQVSKRWSKGKPYLWVIVFSIDGKTIKLTENFKLGGEAFFEFSEGSHGNLQKETVKEGESVAIPEHLGKWEVELESIGVPFFNYAIPGIMGVVAVLMLEKNVTESGAEAGHSALNEYVQQAVNQAIGEFDVKEIDVENIQKSIKEYFVNKTDSLAHGVEDAVKDAIVKSQNIFQNLWSFIDQDELIGYQVWDYNQFEIEEAGGKIRLQKRWATEKEGDWEILGTIKRVADSAGDEESAIIEVDIESDEE